MNKSTAAKMFKPDVGPSATAMEAEIIAGLSGSPKRIAPKYFYDSKGSALFDAITKQDEYYIPRVEQAIYADHRDSMCAAVGQGKTIAEPGAGSCQKIGWLLPELNPAVYVPMDISARHLRQSAAGLRNQCPDLKIEPQVCDHTAGLDVFSAAVGHLHDSPLVFFYPGSSIGNFERSAAVKFLRAMRSQMDRDGGLLIGVDAKKDSNILHAAYNDAAGVTAEFNLNVIEHLNNLLDGDLCVADFSHVAFYNAQRGRIEMHLRCRRAHTARLAGQLLEFAEGELIHTENSYKYHPDEFIGLAAEAGFTRRQLWQDARGWFSVLYFVPA